MKEWGDWEIALAGLENQPTAYKIASIEAVKSAFGSSNWIVKVIILCWIVFNKIYENRLILMQLPMLMTKFSYTTLLPSSTAVRFLRRQSRRFYRMRSIRFPRPEADLPWR